MANSVHPFTYVGDIPSVGCCGRDQPSSAQSLLQLFTFSCVYHLYNHVLEVWRSFYSRAVYPLDTTV